MRRFLISSRIFICDDVVGCADQRSNQIHLGQSIGIEPGFVIEKGFTADEYSALRKMLDGRGVQPFPAAVLEELRAATKLPGASLATLVAKYRQQGKVGNVLFGVSKQSGKPRSLQIQQPRCKLRRKRLAQLLGSLSWWHVAIQKFSHDKQLPIVPTWLSHWISVPHMLPMRQVSRTFKQL
jgi:hypothetical protein